MTKVKCSLKHIHLIPADFEEYNLENLEMENEKNNGVCWKNGNENGMGAQKFNLNDVVYIYFHDTRDITNRILLKASVCKTDNADDGSDSEYTQQYLYDDSKKIKGFYLNNFYAINEEYAHNNVFKCLHKCDIDEQSKETGILGVKINQTKRYLDNSDDEKVKNLLNKLEQPHLFSRKLKALIQEFNDNVCQVCKGKEKSSNTFKKTNGLFYYEIHHVLMQNFNSVISNLSENEIKEKYPWYDKKIYGTNKKNILIYNNGFNENTQGIFTRNLSSLGGCDSIITLNLQVTNLRDTVI